ncbi:hypothetical protein C8R44DRAFT_741897 [Mycena epipterygia]|nr:hypothetical protein C8R44DRAFT_741897 [Mycena epipterygia]
MRNSVKMNWIGTRSESPNSGMNETPWTTNIPFAGADAAGAGTEVAARSVGGDEPQCADVDKGGPQLSDSSSMGQARGLRAYNAPQHGEVCGRTTRHSTASESPDPPLPTYNVGQWRGGLDGFGDGCDESDD